MNVASSWNRQEVVYMMQMSLHFVIRQKIEALPETVSKEDVLKILDECKPGKPEGMGNWPSIPS